MTLLVLVLVSAVAIYTSRTILFEGRISGNDFRGRQAFRAAESGLSLALRYLGTNGGADKDDDGAIDPVFDTDGDGIGDTNTTAYPDGSSATIRITGAFPAFAIQATGVSDDRTATRTVRSISSVVDALPTAPSNPLTTRGAVVISGAATVFNPEGTSTIWSGDDVNLGSNNATATEIADPTDASYPTCMQTPMTCDTTRTSNRLSVGLDVIESDSSLSNMSPEEFFQNFFGMSMEYYRKTRVTLEVLAGNANNLASDDAGPGVHLATGEVVWVEGNTSLENRTTIGCEVELSGGAMCSSAETDPSIVIVNGDLVADGTPNVTGLLYVVGNIAVTGNAQVTGALISGGELDNGASGSLDVWYHSGVLAATRDNGPTAGAPGSWRDW